VSDGEPWYRLRTSRELGMEGSDRKMDSKITLKVEG